MHHIGWRRGSRIRRSHRDSQTLQKGSWRNGKRNHLCWRRAKRTSRARRPNPPDWQAALILVGSHRTPRHGPIDHGLDAGGIVRPPAFVQVSHPREFLRNLAKAAALAVLRAGSAQALGLTDALWPCLRVRLPPFHLRVALPSSTQGFPLASTCTGQLLDKAGLLQLGENACDLSHRNAHFVITVG